MAKRNPFTDAVLNVVEEWKAVHARPRTAIPFGLEEVSPATARQRLALMSPAEREALVGQVGIDAVLKMVGGA